MLLEIKGFRLHVLEYLEFRFGLKLLGSGVQIL